MNTEGTHSKIRQLPSAMHNPMYNIMHIAMGNALHNKMH